MNIPAEKQYEYLTHHLEYLNEKIIDTFTLFIKLSTAIIGGVFYLRWQLTIDGSIRVHFALISKLLFSVVSLSLILLIFNNRRSWGGYRKRLTGEYPGIPPTSKFLSVASEVVMCSIITVTCVGFWFINPLNY
jgi:hypothetical protein